MSQTIINPDVLALNTRGGDCPDAGAGVNSAGAANGIVATSAADGWQVIAALNGQEFAHDRIVFRMTVTTAATYVFKAGDRYPAQRADLGDLSIAMATNDTRFIVIETSRFLKNDGTIDVTATNQATDTLACYVLPKAA